MNSLTTSTALALVLGLGLAVASPAALAQGEAGEQQQETERVPQPEAGEEVETGVGTGDQAGGESAVGCDVDGDGYISTAEARTCLEQQFGAVAGPEGTLTEQQLAEVMPEAELSRIDEDGDGEISRAEWISWREQGFAEAAQGEDRMPTSDYETWHRGGEPGAQQHAGTPAAKPMRCDTDGDDYVDVEEARVCAEMEFGEMGGDEDLRAMGPEAFAAAYQGADEPSAVFSQIDADGDGEITREEWVSWREHGFAEAAEGEDRLSTTDPVYERWRGPVQGPEGAPSGTGDTGGAGSEPGSGSTD